MFKIEKSRYKAYTGQQGQKIKTLKGPGSRGIKSPAQKMPPQQKKNN
jgi:hypothetical protein